MKPIFTVHAGEFLVGSFIESQVPDHRVWIPSRDTETDLLVTDKSAKKTVSIQVKFSKDFLPTHMADAFQPQMKACGWFTFNTKKIADSEADLWVIALYRFDQTELDYVILPPSKFLSILHAVHGNSRQMIQSYVWVTKAGRCWEARGIKKQDQLAIANGGCKNSTRDMTPFLNNWTPLSTAFE